MMKTKFTSVRTAYLGLFFANAIFATLFKSLGESMLAKFGTFDECHVEKLQPPSCMGSQLVFRASFSISQFFLLRTLLSRFAPTQSRKRAFRILCAVEIPLYLALLIGSFFIPSSFFHGYAQVARVLSGFFILFQIASIVDFSYQARDLLLDRIEKAETPAGLESERFLCGSTNTCTDHELNEFLDRKSIFLGTCSIALIVTAIGAGFLYEYYGSCAVGVAFTTITVVAVALLVALCISNWLDVGLLPPCVVSSYLVLMCWQALTSNPDKSCEQNGSQLSSSPADSLSSEKSMVANAIIAAFAMTWTSWRTSSAASNMFAKPQAPPPEPLGSASASASRVRRKDRHQPSKQQFSGAVVVNMDGTTSTSQDEGAENDADTEAAEPWQFYCMMCIAGLYMAMALTDWDSADGSSNGVSMWVKIVAQWLTILLFFWTIMAPKLFPDRDFS